jgi:SAM-dependent methyltransferase
MESEYFIRADYVANRVAKTRDSIDEREYWTAQRRRAASYYQWPVYEYAQEMIRSISVRRCIDIGCGTGVKLAQLSAACSGVEFVGIDQPSAIRLCKDAYGHGHWHADDIENPDPALDGLRGDLLICADVIEHVENPDKVLEYLKRRLAPGGVVILSTPDRDTLRGQDCVTCPNRFHVREWNFSELRAYLSSRGFRIRDHFLQLPVRLGLNAITYHEVVKRVLRRRPVKYNQVCVLELR